MDETERNEMDNRHLREYQQLKIKHAKEGSTRAQGDLFETKVASMFPEKYFTIVNYTPRREDLSRRLCENATDPDFLFRDNNTGEEFYIECKYRSDEDWDCGLSLCEYYHLKKYRESHDIETFFVIGYKGDPINPKTIFCISAADLKYPKTTWPSKLENNKIYLSYFSSLKQLRDIPPVDWSY